MLNQPVLRRDRLKTGIGLGAVAFSVIALVMTYYHKAILLYGDTISHLEIARRTDSMLATSPINAPGQLGAVWLPLPHLLMMPFAWNNTLYQDGLAGSIISMIAFVLTVVLIYGIGLQLTGQRLAGLVAAAVFGLNANMLYMQTTPMTESLLFCLLAAMVYFVLKWADTDRSRYLVIAGGSALLATLTRYESWTILACMAVALTCIAWTKDQNLPRKLHLRRVIDRVLLAGFIGLSGIIFWLAWNWIFLGNPLYFQDGLYAKPALWLSNHEPAIGHLGVAFKTYWLTNRPIFDNLHVRFFFGLSD
jgi:4-amino-4-deoxy-L-arabinose transferase-like glycosyltransferase